MGDNRPTICRIDLDALAFNYRSARSFIGDDVEIMAVVKADAYGHGAVPCAKRLVDAGCAWLAVALIEEAVELRQAGLQTPILVLGSFWPGQEQIILDHGLTPTIFSVSAASLLNAAAKRRGMITEIHLKIDTGMGRVGFRPDECNDFARSLAAMPNLNVTGMMTHFAAADDLAENDFTDSQMTKFDSAITTFAEHNITPEVIDLANSPGAVAHPASRRSMVRLGGILYGLGGDVLPAGIDIPELRPVMSVLSQITYLKTVPMGETIGYGRTFSTKRDSIIATIPIGYADGFPRALSNKGSMLVRGEPAPIVGRVSMDWTMVDVTDIDNASVGDMVTLIGTDRPNSINAERLAADTGTISYEITCGFSKRVPRSFF